MRKIFIIGMMLSISISFAFAYGVPGDVELTLEDVSINPIDPKVGDSIIITAEVSNSGIVQTNSAASIITIAFFVDDKLLDVKDIGIVEPGKSNKIKISSEPIWQAESGKHMIKVVLDYHDTLRDKYDSPDDNTQEKEIVIKYLNPTNLELTIHPEYGRFNEIR